MEDEEINFNYYIEIQKSDIEKFRREISQKEGRNISEEEAFSLWIKMGRAKEFHDDYTIREHLNNNLGEK